MAYRVIRVCSGIVLHGSMSGQSGYSGTQKVSVILRSHWESGGRHRGIGALVRGAWTKGKARAAQNRKKIRSCRI